MGTGSDMVGHSSKTDRLGQHTKQASGCWGLAAALRDGFVMLEEDYWLTFLDRMGCAGKELLKTRTGKSCAFRHKCNAKSNTARNPQHRFIGTLRPQTPLPMLVPHHEVSSLHPPLVHQITAPANAGTLTLH